MTNPAQLPPVSQQLPFDIRTALARAARTPVDQGDPLARVKAINEVTARAKAMAPPHALQDRDLILCGGATTTNDGNI
ncbi:MAG: hypothetical protein ACRC7G_02450 [Beijerinckiaceae bacterium]